MLSSMSCLEAQAVGYGIQKYRKRVEMNSDFASFVFLEMSKQNQFRHIVEVEGGSGLTDSLTGLGQFPGLITFNTVIEDQFG